MTSQLSASADRDDDPIEPEILEQLMSIGGPEFVAELAEVFLTDLDQLVESLRASLPERGDELARKAHFLKGSSANMGLAKLAGACLRVERHARGEDAGAVDEIDQVLQHEAGRASSRLQQLVS